MSTQFENLCPDIVLTVADRFETMVNRRRVLAHAHYIVAGLLGRREMHVRQFGDGVANALVDRAGNLATLGVGERDIHVTGGDRGRHGLETVSDREHDIGTQIFELRGQFDDAHAGRFRHGRGVLALDDGEIAGQPVM